MEVRKYYFEKRDNCEMCGTPNTANKVMGIRLSTTQGLRPKKKSGIGVTVVKCKNCGLVFADPMPVPFDIADHYNVPPESYWKESYFVSNDQYFAKEIVLFKKLSGRSSTEGLKVLDIGAGIGNAMKAMMETGFEVYGIEPSEPFYKMAIKRNGIDPEKLKLGMIENVDYEKNYFDFLTFGSVLEHLYHPAASIEKAMNWLKPGGLMQFEVPSAKYLMTKLINTYYSLIGTNYTTHISPMTTPFHLYDFTIDSFVKLGDRLGFEVIAKEFEVCEILNFPRFTHPFFKKIMKTTNTGMQLMIWLKKK
jgi:2-polyprenyl-3-methyl-5-hydroxy-6-metoxy-1,4-benzoquinol methylase